MCECCGLLHMHMTDRASPPSTHPAWPGSAGGMPAADPTAAVAPAAAATPPSGGFLAMLDSEEFGDTAAAVEGGAADTPTAAVMTGSANDC